MNTKTLALAAALVALTACRKELVCPSSETDCGGRCVSLLTDSANCGACGAAVGVPLERCAAGAAACEAGIGVCGGTCTDFARDPLHCGACDVACAPDAYCTTAGGATTCTGSCPEGFTACGRACVDLLADRLHCGACGNACPSGQTCDAGSCRADLQVACYATNEVLPFTYALAPAGAGHTTPAGPAALTVLGGAVYGANGYPAASVSVLPLDPALPSRHVPLAGTDLEAIGSYENVVFVANAAIGSLVLLRPSGDVLDEIAMPGQQSGPNPRGVAIAGTTAYVALYGNGPGSGQSIAKVDLSSLAACASGAAASCGAVTGTIDLASVAGAADPGALPFPSAAASAGGRVYVALANLGEDTISCGPSCTYTGWVKPAGNGRLAVVDPAAGDAVSIVPLPGCGNPGALAVAGSTLWVSCGALSYPDLAPSALVPVDLSTAPPSVGAPLRLPAIVAGKLAFCGGLGYVTDQASGAVVRFDPATRTADDPRVVCPTSAYGWAWAADVACSE